MAAQSEIYGNTVNKLKQELKQVRSQWKDSVASSFDCINDNVEKFVLKIQKAYDDSDETLREVEESYNESEFDNILRDLSSRLSAV